MLKSTGVVRTVDEMGRVILPVELRRHYHIDKGDALEVFVDGSKIIFRKYQPFCVFCGNGSDLKNFGGKNVCSECIEELKKPSSASLTVP